MNLQAAAAATRARSASDAAVNPNMIWIPGGTFRMGSDKHYPEEAPAHRATVDGFWADRVPATNRDLRKLVPAARHAEAIDPSTSHLGFRSIMRGKASP